MVAAAEGVGDTAALAGIAARASAECDGFPADWLVGYVTAVAGLLRTGTGLDSTELSRCAAIGDLAAVTGISLPVVVDAYLSATRLLWTEVRTIIAADPPASLSVDQVIDLGQRVLRAADDALASVAQGYARARRAVVRQEETLRRQFVEDVLTGGSDVAELVARADRYGLHLTAPHLVAVTATHPTGPGPDLVVAGLEEQLRARLGDRELLVTVKAGRIVTILGARGRAGSPATTVRELGEVIATQTAAVAHASLPTRVVLGREYDGPGGIAMSYREASEALGLAADVSWPHRVVLAEELAVYRVLLRDVEALRGLVQTVLAPLTGARGGAGPLLDTLTTFFGCGGVITETAQRLHLSPRAVTYRLNRIRELTGHDPGDPANGLTLQIAAAGARLLHWPGRTDPA